MKERPLPQRKQMRKPDYDYSEGMFFVSVVTQFRQLLFGQVEDGQVLLSEAGKMIVKWWNELEHKYGSLRLDTYIIMPDHVQGIIVLKPSVEETISLSDVMQWFKTMTTNEYIRGVKEGLWPEFEQKVWQRSFHDQIIENTAHLENVRRYINNNPHTWTPLHEGLYYKDPL
jgi:putative transposase